MASGIMLVLRQSVHSCGTRCLMLILYGSVEIFILFMRLQSTRQPQKKPALNISSGGTLTSETDTFMLNAIRILAVRELNTMVTRVTDCNAWLRGQARVCKFFIQYPKCNNDVNYTDEILRDIVTHNLIDSLSTPGSI